MRYRLRGGWLQLLSGILMIVSGILFFTNPTFVPSIFIYILAFSTLASGISALIFVIQNRNHPLVPTSFLLNAVLNILLGILLFFVDPVSLGVVLIYVLAGWMLLQSIFQIFGALRLKRIQFSSWWVGLVIAILGIVLAVLCLINPMGLLTGFAIITGIYLLVYGVVRVVEFFIYR